MPKLKTHSGAKKRVKLSSGGKLLRAHAGGNHFLTKKRSTRKRQYTRISKITAGDRTKIKRSLGV